MIDFAIKALAFLFVVGFCVAPYAIEYLDKRFNTLLAHNEFLQRKCDMYETNIKQMEMQIQKLESMNK